MNSVSRRLPAIFIGFLACLLVLAVLPGRRTASASSPGSGHATEPGQAGSSLRAGASRIDITPTTPVAMNGYENPENRISEGLHDRLYARALAFASGDKRLVLVSVDVNAMTLGEYFRRPILERFGLQPDELLLCEIHTHSGPQVSLSADYPHPNNLPYTRELERRLVRVVGQALASMAPAQLSVGRGSSTVGASRRKPTADGRIEMAANLEGPADHELLVLEVARPGRGALAALFNYSCHSRSLRSPNRLISGDVQGLAEQYAEQALKGRIVAAFPGASGDSDPVTLADGFDASPSADPPPPVRQGNQLGADVLAALGVTRRVSGPTTIRTATRKVPLPAKVTGAPPRFITVVVAAVGSVAFVGLDCEAVAEIGLGIKAESPFKDTFVLSICNGWAGYLPVAHQYAEGGYEVARTPYGRGAAERLVQEVKALLTTLK